MRPGNDAIKSGGDRNRKSFNPSVKDENSGIPAIA